MQPRVFLLAFFLLCNVAAADEPSFAKHVVPLLSRLGCNGGSCHGAVQGKNGFRLSLFGVDPTADHEQLVRAERGRRVNLLDPAQSLLLLKPSGQVPHGGGRLLSRDASEFAVLANWIAAGAKSDSLTAVQTVGLKVEPAINTTKIDSQYQLRVTATFADGSTEDVTKLCVFESRAADVANVSATGQVEATGVGDTSILVRYGAEPTTAMVVVPRAGEPVAFKTQPNNFIDEQVFAKLRQLNIAPAELADDATFLRRVRLDVTGQLPTPAEIVEFSADTNPQKRSAKINKLLDEPGYAALWTLKFCDLLRASDFGVYADGLKEDFEAPRFQAWIRARLEENIPYDEFAARILTATSTEGRSIEAWADELIALQEGYKANRTDLEIYRQRKTLDAYWQRKGAGGVSGAMQVAHAFLGLRLECAQCHRHPHDVWSQDDLLSFANFFMRVREVGFSDKNEKLFPAAAPLFKKFGEEGKRLQEESKKRKEGEGKNLADDAKKLQTDVTKLRAEIDKEDAPEKREQLASLEKQLAEMERVQQEIRDMDRRGKLLADDVAKRMMHAQILNRTDLQGPTQFAKVSSPLGTQTSSTFRFLGDAESLKVAADEDPRERVAAWMRRPDNPYFAKAIVNRVWSHYFGRGIIDPPDDLSPLNPPSHPELLAKLCAGLIANRYDLKWLHRTILNSHTYQQTSVPSPTGSQDRSNYAYFHLRRLPAEVLLDTLNQATGTKEDLDMKYFHWPDEMKTVEIPFKPRNPFVVFMLEQLGRPARNSSVQCDCERQSEASMLQVLSFTNHPRIWQKLADPKGLVANVSKKSDDSIERISQLFLNSVSRQPTSDELAVCQKHVAEAESLEVGLRSVLWSLLNTKEFVLQH